MSLRTMPKAALPDWIEYLVADYHLIGPRPVNGHFSFDEVHSASEIDLDYTTTILPPKKVLTPPREELVRFEKDGKKAEASFDERPTVIFGMHTCDLHAISLLDQAFSRGYPDQNYLTRRRNTTIISIECLTPCTEHAFCKDMGTLSVPDNFDLHLTDCHVNRLVIKCRAVCQGGRQSALAAPRTTASATGQQQNRAAENR